MREGFGSGDRPERGRAGCMVVEGKKRRRLAAEEAEEAEESECGDEDLVACDGRRLDARDGNAALDFGRKRRGLVGLRESIGTDGDRCVDDTEIVEKRNRMRALNYSEDDESSESLDDDEDEDGAFLRSKVVLSDVKVPNGKCRDVGVKYSRSINLRERKGEDFIFDCDSAFSVEQDRKTDLKDGIKYETREDRCFHSDGPVREKFENAYSRPIRVQGKNGVLKVMLNGKKKLGASDKKYDHGEARFLRKASNGKKDLNWEAPFSPTLCLEPKFRGRARSAVVRKKKENARDDLSGNRGSWNNKAETCYNSLFMGSKGVATSVLKKGNNSLTSKANGSVGCKEREVRRGNATEKQLLRERIRHLLLNAGWTIDFRPRKNRNYQDAVYINPSGTEYWSIIKAYDALKRHYEDGTIDCKDGIGSSFKPIPEEVLCQLTRQTRKKMEREKIMKQKGHKRLKSSENEFHKKQAKVKMGCNGDGKMLDSFTRKNGKSLKFRIKDSNSIVINDKKSCALSDDAGFNEAQHLLQVDDVSSGALGKEMTESSHMKSQGRKHKKQIGRSLLVRSSKKGAHSGDNDFVPYSGKRTILSWLIDMGTVPMSGKVQYMNKRRTRTLLEGWITKDGIHCGCCSKILTVSKFEIHAGSKLRQPFQHIFLEDGVSLLQCHIDAWNKQEKRESSGFCSIDCDCDDPNDDTCTLCGDGGDLICCDGCPSTFHQSCLNLPMLPVGDWHCPNCSCKFCKGIGGTTGQGKDATLSLRTCSLCEEKYHQLCRQDIETRPVDPSASTSFCDQSCKKIFQKLRKLLGVKQELDAGFSWTLIQRSNLDSDTFDHNLTHKAECNSRLAVALSVMDECFLPIIDRRSGINLINGVLYNCESNFRRLNFSGFYTAVLERGDEIISAASIRIHGSKLAEMPFIGTRHIYRRQGMCRRLLNAIESALCSMNVEKLVIPAISDLMDTWTRIFNFKPLEESHRQEIKSMNILVFPATGLLQKQLLMNKLFRKNASDFSVVRAIKLESNCCLVTENTVKSDIGSSEDIHFSDEGLNHQSQGFNNEIVLTETSPHGLGGSCFDDVSNKSSNHDHVFHVTGKEAAADAKLPPDSVATDDDEFKVENGHTPGSSSDGSKFLSIEENVNNALGINVETAGGDSEFHFAESSLQGWTTKNKRYFDASCSCNWQSTNRNILQSNSKMAYPEVQGTELNTDEVCHFVSDVTVCEEHASCGCAGIMNQGSCELKAEDIAIVPNEIEHVKDSMGSLPDIITQLEDATPANSFQCSGHNDMFRDTESAGVLHRNPDFMSESSTRTRVRDIEPCMSKDSQHVQQCALTSAPEPGTFQAEGEASNGEFDLQVTQNYAAVATLEVEEAVDRNIDYLVGDSDMAFSDGSTLNISELGEHA